MTHQRDALTADPHPPSAQNLMSPTKKDFEHLVAFLLRQLDPHWRLLGKLEDEVPAMLAWLKYPFQARDGMCAACRHGAVLGCRSCTVAPGCGPHMLSEFPRRFPISFLLGAKLVLGFAPAVLVT